MSVSEIIFLPGQEYLLALEHVPKEGVFRLLALPELLLVKDQVIDLALDKNIGFMWHLGKIWETLPEHPRMRGVDFAGPWHEILETAVRLESHFNHLSTHCGGLVVVPDEIRRYCPVEISASGLQVLQWEKDSAEEGGLVKIDILGNRSLAVIRDSLEMVEENHGLRIEYSELNPLHDPETSGFFTEGTPSEFSILRVLPPGRSSPR